MKKIACLVFAVLLLFLAACSTKPLNKIQACVNTDTLNKTYDFQNNVAWVECFVEYKRFRGLIDKTGKTLFTDYEGLTDANDKKYRLHSYFDAVNCTYDFSDVIDVDGVEYNDLQIAWQFNEGYALVLCQTDSEDCFCLIDMQGNVKYAIPLGTTLSYSDIEEIVAYYNGSGTYYINWNGKEEFISVNNGLITPADYRWCVPVRGGYFAYQIQKKDFNTDSTTYCLMDANGDTISQHTIEGDTSSSDYRFYLSETEYSLFLNENIAMDVDREGIYYVEESIRYYNIHTGKEFTVAKPLNTIVQTNDDYYFADFSYSSNQIVFCEVTYEKIGSGYGVETNAPVFNIYSINENGEQSLVYTHAAKQYIDLRMGDYLLGHTDQYALFYFEDGVYLVDIKTGAEKKMLSDYTDKLSSGSEHYWLTNNLIGARIYGKDGKPYCTIVDFDGNILLELTPSKPLSSLPMESIGSDVGFVYYSLDDTKTIFFNSGKNYQLTNWSIPSKFYCYKEQINLGNNYIDQNGNLLF